MFLIISYIYATLSRGTLDHSYIMSKYLFHIFTQYSIHKSHYLMPQYLLHVPHYLMPHYLLHVPVPVPHYLTCLPHLLIYAPVSNLNAPLYRINATLSYAMLSHLYVSHVPRYSVYISQIVHYSNLSSMF